MSPAIEWIEVKKYEDFTDNKSAEGNATMLFYEAPEGREGRDAFLEKRAPDFGKYPRVP